MSGWDMRSNNGAKLIDSEYSVTVSRAPDRWIRRLRPSPFGDMLLICLPHAGGSASAFFALSQLLDRGIDVSAVQYPGRQDRRFEPQIDSIPELGALLADVLVEHIDRPYAIFGHSMGALVAFEVVHRLAARDVARPAGLFVSGRRAPSTRRIERVHLADDAGLIAELRLLAGTDQRFLADDEMLSMILPVTRGDFRAVETYTFADGTPLDCPTFALVGDSDPRCTHDEAAAWARHTSDEFELRVFPGGHFFLDGQREAVARYVSDTLGRVSSPGMSD